MPYSDSNYCRNSHDDHGRGPLPAPFGKEVNFGILDMREQALLDFRMTNEADALSV
ncbi:MAG: hypothetical protein ACLUQ6_12735 [Alistipes onderdonkii]